jgi:hypothetical protein
MPRQRPVPSSELETSPISLGRIARGFTVITAILGAWLYFTGWAYLYSYFDYFGINLIEIDPSLQFVFLHSLPPLRYYLVGSNIFTCLLVYIIIVFILYYIIGFSVIYSRIRFLLSPLGQFFLASLIVFLLFYASFSAARTAGTQSASYFWRHPPRLVYFNFKQDPSTLTASPVNLAMLNSEMKLKYLMSTKDFHYAFYREQECKEPHCGLIFKIPTDNVNEIMTIQE